MKKVFVALLGASLASGAGGQNLIVNGNAESGNLTGWMLDASAAPAGNAIFGAPTQSVNGFLPAEGARLFVFDNAPTQAAPNSMIVVRMFQEHAIPAGATALDVGAFVASDPSFGSCDPTRVIMTLLDSGGAPVAGGFDTGWFFSPDWLALQEHVVLSAGATSFRLEFLGRLDCGVWIDTFFDGISVVAIVCPADFDGSGQVDITDLLQLLAAWGPCASCAEDLNDDGVVNTVDLLAILAAWGPCQ